jgi:hypothetical protein
MGLAFFVEFLRALHLEIVIAGFIGIRNFWVNPFILCLNSVIALLIVLFYLKFVIYLTQISYKTSTIRVVAHKNKWSDEKISEILFRQNL